MSLAWDFIERATKRRCELGLSQTEVGRRMAEAGFDWHQTTVSRTEIGERPIRLDEALALADLLCVSVADPDADVYRAALRRAEETIARIANIAQAHACAPLADEHGSPSVPGDPRASQSPTGALSDPHTEETR